MNRQERMGISGILASIFLIIMIAGLWVFLTLFGQLNLISEMTLDDINAAKNLTFPMNETRLALAVSTYAFLTPLTIMVMIFLIFMIAASAAKAAEWIHYFKQAYDNEPSDSELRDFMKVLYKKERVKHGS